jgi:hypothetical protein
MSNVQELKQFGGIARLAIEGRRHRIGTPGNDRSATHLHRNSTGLGTGEAAQGPTPAAIANAIRNATGLRLTDLPFTPQKLRAALAG